MATRTNSDAKIRIQQEEEIQVLEAVYDQDFEDLRKNDVWKVWRPAEFSILLYPSKEGVSADAQVYASIRIVVKFTDKYPETAPAIEFRDEKGLSTNDVQVLKKRVDEKAATFLGQAMICDLCQFVQEYLHTKNHPPDYQSFYEGMLKNQRRREIVDEDKRRRLEEEQRERERVEWEAIESVLQRRQEERKQEAMQRRIRRSTTAETGDDEENESNEAAAVAMIGGSGGDSGADQTGRNRSTSLPPPPVVAPSSTEKRKGGQLEVIRDEQTKLTGGHRLKMSVKGQDCTIVIGSKMGSTHQWHTDFVGVIEETGQTVIVTEWCVKLKRNNAGKIVVSSHAGLPSALQKDLQALEQEFRSLVKLDHPNLLKYLSLLIFDIRQSTPAFDTFRLIYAKEHSSTSYCVPISHFLRRGLTMPRDYLRSLAKDILSAMDYLHSRATLHKDLNEDCIWDTGGDKFLLSDFALRKRILDLIETYRGVYFNQEQTTNDDENELRGAMIGMGKIGRKSDVFALGACLLKLAIGQATFRKFAGGEHGFVRIPDDESIFHVNDPFRNFVEKMIAREDDQRWACAKLLTHPFLTAEIDGGLDEEGRNHVGGRKHSMRGGGGSDDNEEKDVSAALKLSYPWLGTSTRLETEFDIQRFLGRGGFGDVMKVKNKLDDCVYAIKRIILNPKSKELNKKITREVKLLSRLNHENVVRYYNSWIEQRIVEKPPATDSSLISTASGTSETTTPSPKIVDAKTRTVRTSTPTRRHRPVDQNASPATVVATENGPPKKSLTFKKPEIASPAKPKALTFDEDDDDDVENMAPPPASDKSVEWSSTSFDGRGEDDDDSNSEEDDDDEEDDDGSDSPNDALSSLFYSKDLLDQVSDEDEVEDLVVFEEAGSTAKPPMLQQHSIEENGEKSDLDKAQQRGGETSSTDVVQILYIQMEFCQKSTLRQAIDYAELVDDRKRTWRLFRELLEGLSYIHRQGMIHRDLKPVNIFLDSHDHVKIGDFGLATKLLATLTGQDAAMAALEDISQSGGGGDWANLSMEIQSELTTKIGTALYVSPELCPSPKPATPSATPASSKIAYTQKVDMYSLGIVFFEMLYRPLKTGMERIKLLSDLRRPEIVLPADFVAVGSNEKPARILHRLLQHDADKRPSADDLLRSDLLPPVEMRPSEFQLTVKQTLSNTQTHQYKWLVNVLLDEQFPSSVQEYVYDSDMYDLGHFSAADSLTRQWVEDKLVDLFRTYGAVRVDTPLLLPKSKIFTEHAETRVDVMDRSGCVLHLPYDLRVPFARYAVRCQIAHLKRYCIANVFRDEKRSSHPRQLTECAFDIVANVNGCTLATAEILALTSDVVAEFPALRSHSFSIRINHTSILKAILLYSGVEDLSNFIPIMELLATDRVGGGAAEKLYKRHQKLRNEFRLSEKCVGQILAMMQLEGPLAKISSVLRCITKKKDSPASSLAKEGLHELETIKNNAETLGSTLPIVVSLNLQYNLYEYDGPIFQLVGETKKSNDRKTQLGGEKSNKKSDVRTFAAGGRYDQLLNQFRKPTRMVKAPSGTMLFANGNGASSSSSVQGAVGISFAFDLIAQMSASTSHRRRFGKSPATSSGGGGAEQGGANSIGSSPFDVLICSTGHKLMLKEKLAMVRSLRLARLKADYLQEPTQNLDDLQDSCLRSGIAFLVVMKDAETNSNTIPGSISIRVRFWDKTHERTVDKRLALSDVVGFIQEKRQEELVTPSEEMAPGGMNTGGGSTLVAPYESAGETTITLGVGGGSLGTSGLGSSLLPPQQGATNNLSNLKIHFAVVDRPAHNIRKRIEGNIGNILTSALQKFSPKETLELIATDVPGAAIKQLAAMGEFNRDESAFRTSVTDVISRFNKYKKELRLVVDLISDLKFSTHDERQATTGRCVVIILFSYADECYRFIL